MKVARLYTRGILATTRSAPLAQAAATMRGYQVGVLLVMEDPPGPLRPVGMVTDRDLAMQGFASEDFIVGSVMTPVVATVGESADVHEALEVMRAHGVRRLVVVDAKGEPCGLLSIDDVVDGLATDMAAVAAVLKGEIRRDAAGLGTVKVGT